MAGLLTRLSKRLTRTHRRSIPYEMFDIDRYGIDARSAHVLERIYHKGQRLSWDGKEVLSSLIAEHGKPAVSESDRNALGRIFSVILWGELAAWRISAQLADELDSLEAKMAATSQAFDEARHFYVMYDYLKELEALPDKMPDGAERLLLEVMNTNSLAKKLLGMQLMVEPVALTIFQIIRGTNVEPVLCHLLPYYERDEARHVALGLRYLPALIKDMSPAERLDLFFYQMKLLTLEVITQKTLRKDLEALGIDPRDMIDIGRGKQLKALNEVFAFIDPNKRDMASKVLERYTDVAVEWTLPGSDASTAITDRLSRVFDVMVNGSGYAEEHDIDPGIKDEQVPLIRGLKETLRSKKRTKKKEAS
jgi:hypothetical protein